MKLENVAKTMILGTLLIAPLGGCSVGDAPSGGSSAEVEANFKKLDPQEQIKIIQAGPAPADQKAKLIKDIEDKYGIKANAAAENHGAPNPADAAPPATK